MARMRFILLMPIITPPNAATAPTETRARASRYHRQAMALGHLYRCGDFLGARREADNLGCATLDRPIVTVGEQIFRVCQNRLTSKGTT